MSPEIFWNHVTLCTVCIVHCTLYSVHPLLYTGFPIIKSHFFVILFLAMHYVVCNPLQLLAINLKQHIYIYICLKKFPTFSETNKEKWSLCKNIAT